MRTDETAVVLAMGCLLTALGIALGAFGVHALRDILGEAALGWWQTGVEYQLWNALGLVALGVAPLQRVRPAAALIGVGTVVFSGSLYLMALSDARWLGMVTPIGGLLMIAGWLAAGWAAMRGARSAT